MSEHNVGLINLAQRLLHRRKPKEEISSLPSEKIITLEPVWSKIKGLQPPLAEEVKQQIATHDDYADEFVRPQFAQILDDSQRRFLPTHLQGIGYRAVLTSDESTVTLPLERGGSYTIADQGTIVKQGMEVDTDTVNVSVQRNIRKTIDVLGHHRVLQYLVSGVREVLNSPDPSSRQKVTPAILIYDLSQLQKADALVGGYGVKFKNPVDKGAALLALYPINIAPAK